MKHKSLRILEVVSCLALLTLTPSPAAEPPTNPGVPLRGTVLDASGTPLNEATVMVWTAGVKEGYSTYCPSCYADCGKLDTTDARGAFLLQDLSQDLRFRLLVVREGFAPTFVENVDPVTGEPVMVTLEPREIPPDDSRVVRGRVVDASGTPIRHAVVMPEMVRFLDANGRPSGRGGAVKGLDPLAVTNADGEFELVYQSSAISMTLMVEARGKAARRFDDLSTGRTRHELTLNTGTTIRGRLVLKGQPVSNAQIGLVSKSRFMGEFFEEQRIGTQSDGTFLFSNVPAGHDWLVYGKMDTIVDTGTTGVHEVQTKKDGDIVNVGDIRITPGLRLQGQVVLTDGQPIPDGMRISVSCSDAWDSQTKLLPPDGRFDFVNLRPGDYSLSPAVRGYRLSKENPNLAWSIEGAITADVDDFVILLEPGKEDYAGRAGGRFRGQPLRSAPRP